MRTDLKNKKQSGFTLFELLVVILLVAVVGGASTVILVSALRGSDRTNSINKIRANGNYAVTQMIKMIKYARSFDGVSNADYHSDPDAWQFECSPTKRSLRITSFDGGTTTFDCKAATPSPVTDGEISSNSAALTSSLIDPSGIRVDSCSISCSRSGPNNPYIITIDFVLSAKSSSSFYEKQTSIPFHGSVATRNY
ncbi:MAG: prepilin-type N-terminal cleavage/methylation domain-containing protein [Candidatus Levybacteria bacterium]|nr:prepilin-type N-terminal cleavage/methylation domain-containing protein [Candidatus Levybacteria bacterium]